MTRARIAALYGGGAVALGLLALAAPPVTWLLLWPALSLALVAAAYGGLGPRVFGKRDGRIPWLRRLLLAPYLAGAHLSLRLQTRARPPFVQIVPGLLMGRRLSAREAARLPVRAVLDLTAELTEAAPLRRRTHLTLPVLDLTAPSAAQLEAGVRFIARHRSAGPVYVHCALGYGRAACLVAAYLMESGIANTPADALALVRAAQPRVHLNAGQLDALSRRYGPGAAARIGSPISRISLVRMARAKSS